MKRKILVVEDDLAILTGIVDLLQGEKYEVFQATDGLEALELYKRECPDLILLDIMIPEKSGYDVCSMIRQKDPLIPIVMLTAKGQEVDKVIGLRLGADDYIVKPFGIQELLARVHAALRRRYAHNESKNKDTFSFGKVTINPKTLTGCVDTKTFPLTSRELNLLQLFYLHDNEVLSRNFLLDKVWGITYEGTTRTLDQHIAKLRQKIEPNPASPQHILTVHGVGYRFVANP